MKIVLKNNGCGQHKKHNTGRVQQNVIYSVGEMISYVLLILEFIFIGQCRWYLRGVRLELSFLCTC